MCCGVDEHAFLSPRDLRRARWRNLQPVVETLSAVDEETGLETVFHRHRDGRFTLVSVGRPAS